MINESKKIIKLDNTQPTFAYSKSTIEALEKRCGICSKLIIKTPERRHGRRSCIFLIHFEHISRLFLAFLLLTLSK